MARSVALSDYVAHMQARMAEYGVTARWTPRHAMPSGAAGYAEIARSTIVCPFPENEDAIAVAFHEIGHCCAEACAGPLHARDRSVQDWWQCLRCETLAWATAIALLKPLPFTHGMYQRLTRSLWAYRAQTPGPASSVAALDRLAAPIRFHEQQQADLARDLFADRRRIVKHWQTELQHDYARAGVLTITTAQAQLAHSRRQG